MSSQKERDAALWATLERVANRQKRREVLKPGALYVVEASIDGQVNGTPTGFALEAQTTVGHPTTSLISSIPAARTVVAWLLSRFGPRKREAIVEDMVAEFGETGLPRLSDDLLALAESLLKRLRSQSSAERQGAVSTQFQCTGGQ